MRDWEKGILRIGGPVAAVVAVLCSFNARTAYADVYYYQDADGVFHFTNVPTGETQPFITERPLTNEVIPETRRSGLNPDFETQSFDGIIGEYADRYDVEPALVKAVIRAESAFNCRAISPKGARGLMQLMPRTARIYGVRNIYDARENIHGGVRHLRMLLDKYRNRLPWVLAAYNAGVGPVERYRGIPPFPETRTYVSRVLQFRQQYLRDERLGRVASRS